MQHFANMSDAKNSHLLPKNGYFEAMYQPALSSVKVRKATELCWRHSSGRPLVLGGPNYRDSGLPMAKKMFNKAP